MYVLALQLLSLACCMAVAWLVGRALWRRAETRARAYLLPPAEGQPSQLALLVDSVATVFASRVVSMARTSLMGQASGVSRAIDNAERDAAVEGLAAAHPVVAALTELSPGIQRRLRRSPILAAAIAALSGKLTGGGTPPVPSSNHAGASDQMSFHL